MKNRVAQLLNRFAVSLGVCTSLAACAMPVDEENSGQRAEQKTSESVGEAKSPIVGGQPATEAQRFGTVALLSTANRTPYCTGTLVGENVVVTAAHCVFELSEQGCTGLKPATSVLVSAGALNTQHSTNDQLYLVSKVIGHASFCSAFNSMTPEALKTGQPLHDIAVLVLDRSVTTLKPVGILRPEHVDTYLRAGSSVYVSGYGKLDGTPDAPFGQLYVAQTTFGGRSDTEFKAGGYGQANTCKGDSGGPVYIEAEGDVYLVGATSRDTYDALVNQQMCRWGGIYTLVPAYLNWIESNASGQTNNAVGAKNPAIVSPDNADGSDGDGGCSISATGAAKLPAWPALLGLAVAGLFVTRRRTRG